MTEAIAQMLQNAYQVTDFREGIRGLPYIISTERKPVPTTNCRNCGSNSSHIKCEYCGTEKR